MTNEKSTSTVSLILFTIIVCLLFPAFILFLAGDWFWIEGWIFSIWFLVMLLSISIYLALKDPALLAERSKLPDDDNQKKWDKYFLFLVYGLFILWLILMPLDAKRFGWSPAFPLWLKVIGGLALLPSLFLLYRSIAQNTFASTKVRIQTERKQHVISTGVYGFVRHPMYLGNSLLCVGAPLMLGSMYGLLLGVIAIFLMVGRIIGEEKMLINELEGYEDYTKKVKCRLIPFVW